MTEPEHAGESRTWLRDHQFWTEHGVHSPPLANEVPLLREVAHAAWHMLDAGGEYPDDDGLYIVAAVDWQRLLTALDNAGWSADASANARLTGSWMAPVNALHREGLIP